MTASINHTQLSNFILSTIDKKGWSLRKAALNIGVSASYLSNLTNKKADSNPKPATLDKIANGLGVDKQDVYDAAEVLLVGDDGVDITPKGLRNRWAHGFDIAKALENDEYMLNDGRKLTQGEKDAIKAILRINHD